MVVLRGFSFSQDSRSYTSFNISCILCFLFALRLFLILIFLVLLLILVLSFLRGPASFRWPWWRWRCITSSCTTGAFLKEEAEDVQQKQDTHAIKICEESLVIVER